MSTRRTNSSGQSLSDTAPLLALLRPHQWIKNGFVAAPLFFTPAALSPATAAVVAAGVVTFCVLSSAVYVVNDYLDRDLDRQHREKRHRPLAAGTVSTARAFVLTGVLTVLGLVMATALSPSFLGFAAIYVALNLAYSLKLKHLPILDVCAISISFILRVYGGAVLIDVVPSAWILVCTGLLALLLAIAKRRDDLVNGLGEGHRGSLSGYTIAYLDSAISIVLGALLIAYLIYTTDTQVTARLGTERLYITAPFVVAGLLRYLQITIVEKRSGSPTRIVFTDRFIQIAVLGWLATFGLLIYS